jgi:ribosomal protein S18 acetylase RimI-like enzyme
MIDWRNATPADRALMARLDASLFAHLAVVPGLGDKLVAMQIEARDRGWRAAWPGARCLVVEKVEAEWRQAVGRLWLDHGAKALHLIDIALLPEQRGRGTGTRCLHRLLAEARTAGVDMTLEVAADNRAQHLYRRLGFVEIGQCPPYLQMRRAAHAEFLNALEDSHEQA